MSTPIAAESQPNMLPPLNFIALLRQMLKTSDKVSDLIFSPGRPPQVELGGNLQPVRFPGLEKLTPAHTASMATQEGALPYATNANNLLLRLGDLGGQAPVLKAPATSLEDDTMLDMIER
jgi:hypothetical protein